MLKLLKKVCRPLEFHKIEGLCSCTQIILYLCQIKKRRLAPKKEEKKCILIVEPRYNNIL
jgi:hypothetical protein